MAIDEHSSRSSQAHRAPISVRRKETFGPLARGICKWDRSGRDHRLRFEGPWTRPSGCWSLVRPVLIRPGLGRRLVGLLAITDPARRNAGEVVNAFQRARRSRCRPGTTIGQPGGRLSPSTTVGQTAAGSRATIPDPRAGRQIPGITTVSRTRWRRQSRWSSSDGVRGHNSVLFIDRRVPGHNFRLATRVRSSLPKGLSAL